MKSRMWEESRLGLRPRRTWREAVVRYSEEAGSNRSFVHTQNHLRWIDPHFGELYLDEITRDRIDAARTRRLQDGVSAATTNRLLEIIRTVMRRAEREWDWIDKAPHIRLMPEPRARERVLTDEETIRLLSELPPHLRAVVCFALETGLRMREMLRLRWCDVDLQNHQSWVTSANAKNGRARAVPLSDIAEEIIRAQIGRCETHVFSYEGKSMDRVNQNAWRQALKRANIEEFRFHDLRRTWATWQARSGTPLSALQAMGGWRTAQIVQRYAHLQPGHLQPYAERMSSTVGLGAILAPQLRLGYAADSRCAQEAQKPC